MSDVSETTAPAADAPVRSTTSVLGLLAVLVAVPLLVLIAIMTFRGSGTEGAGAAFADSVDEDRIQAVYLASDEVFFGRVRDGEGGVFILEDAFFLRRTEAAEGADEEADAGLDLVSVAQDVQGAGDLVVNAAEVVRIQDLQADAEIAESIEKALE